MKSFYRLEAFLGDKNVLDMESESPFGAIVRGDLVFLADRDTACEVSEVTHVFTNDTPQSGPGHRIILTLKDET